VPKASVKQFIRGYETLVPMVVPRSANVITTDDEFFLYSVTVFKKSVPEFLHKCRESKWYPREFKWSDGVIEDLKKEKDKAFEQERRLWVRTI
jgi:V-type H+-transporting ATPase subunit C